MQAGYGQSRTVLLRSIPSLDFLTSNVKGVLKKAHPKSEFEGGGGGGEGCDGWSEGIYLLYTVLHYFIEGPASWTSLCLLTRDVIADTIEIKIFTFDYCAFRNHDTLQIHAMANASIQSYQLRS
jgi:hypothetical protein